MVADRFVRTNPIVASKVGALLRVRPSLWLGQMEYVGGHGDAHYQLVVKGSAATATIYFDLVCIQDTWQITDASMALKGRPERILLKTSGHQ